MYLSKRLKIIKIQLKIEHDCINYKQQLFVEKFHTSSSCRKCNGFVLSVSFFSLPFISVVFLYWFFPVSSQIFMMHVHLCVCCCAGCMRDVRLNGHSLPLDGQSSEFVMVLERRGVQAGCHSDACRTKPCQKPLYCVDLWRKHECRWDYIQRILQN